MRLSQWLSVVAAFVLVTAVGCVASLAQAFTCPIQDAESCSQAKSCMYAVVGNPTSFWHCDPAGKATMFTCGAGTHWDDARKECD